MTEVALYEAKNRLSELIERVQRGEVIAITRRGKVVAQLALPTGQDSASAARDAVAGLLAARQGVSLGRLKARDLIAEGPALSVALVADASVSAAWFLPDEATPYTEAALQATAEGEVWVPALWLLEVGNLMLSAQRRRRITAAKRQELVAHAQALRLRVDREPVAMITLDALAARHGLSAYDAAYLELALRRTLPLATLDEALQKAMADAGVERAEF